MGKNLQVAVQIVIMVIAMYTGNWGLAFAMAVSIMATLMMDEDALDPMDYGQKLTMNTRSTQEPVRVIYGKVKVGGNDVYMTTAGEDNKNLWIVQTLGEGECEGIEQIGTEMQIWLDDVLISKYGGYASYYFHNGAADQTVDLDLQAASPSNEWTDNQRNTCYIIWRLRFNTDLYLRSPARVLVLKGKKLHDFRKGDSGQLLSNGTFDTDTGWVKETGWTIAGGVANCDGSQTGISSLKQDCEIATDALHKVVFTISNYVAGTVTPYVGGTGVGTARSANGTYTEYITESLGNGRFYLVGSADFSGDIDNVTVEIALEWSDNPALALYDYMTNTRYGMGVPPSQIDIQAWTDTANYCDLKGWTLNFGIVSLMNADTIINTICMHFRGQLVWYNNTLFLKYADLNYESSVMDVEDKQLAIEQETGKALISVMGPSRFGIPDGIRVSFMDPEKDYSVDNIVIGETTGVISDFNLIGCTNKQQALDLAVYQLERLQWGRSITGTFSDDLARLDPHDLVNLTCDSLGISSALLRVQSTEVRPDGLVDLSFSYESLEFYDDDYDFAIEDIFGCTLPDPTAVPPEVTNANIEEELYWYRLRSFSRLNITFGPPANYPYFDHVEVWRSWDGIDWSYLYDVSTDFSIDPVEEGVTYFLRLRPVSIYGVKRDLDQSTTLNQTVQGKTSAPESMTSLTAVPTDLGVNLYGEKVADPDVELYEFRLNSWGGVFLGAGRSPDLSLKGVKPGFHIFFCNTLGNNGVYGNIPVSASATVQEPKGWTIPPGIEIPDDYSSGTFNNMEQFWYNSAWFLKCSHAGEILSGEYWSPIYDLEDYDPTIINPESFLTYIEADIVVTGVGTRWQDVLYEGATKLKWSEVGVDRRRWYEIFGISEAPRVSMKMIWGTSPTAMDYEAERMEILSAIITAKFVQFYVKIEDPSAAVNALIEHYIIKMYQ